MKLGDYVLYWFTTYRMPHQQRNTQLTCLNLINNHIISSDLADIPIDKVTPKDIQLFLNDQRLHGCKKQFNREFPNGKPLSPHSIVKLRQFLIAAFKQAIKENIVTRNIAEYTEPVSLSWHDSPVFTPENQKKFLQATRNHRFYTAYVLLFFLGCRRSEILGLSWDNIDFRSNILKIRQVLIMEDGKPVLRDQTKTKASIRTIPFPKEIKYLLQEWRERQKIESKANNYHNEYNLVFANKDGSPHNPSYFSRNFKNTIRRLGFCANELHLHSTRHTWATNMIQCGIAISDVQSIGGWSRPDTLLNIYSHTVKESQRKAMKKLYNELNS